MNEAPLTEPTPLRHPLAHRRPAGEALELVNEVVEEEIDVNALLTALTDLLVSSR